MADLSGREPIDACSNRTGRDQNAAVNHASYRDEGEKRGAHGAARVQLGVPKSAPAPVVEVRIPIGLGLAYESQ